MRKSEKITAFFVFCYNKSKVSRTKANLKVDLLNILAIVMQKRDANNVNSLILFSKLNVKD